MKITLEHGSGGSATAGLIQSVFAAAFSNPILNEMEDSAVVEGKPRLAVTTDSFVVTPLFYSGGDIGRLAVCGTVNDLLMRGAKPQYLTAAFIIEEGCDSETLVRVAQSMRDCAAEAGVTVICGDTKVIEGNGGIYINTTGIGFVGQSTDICSRNLREGDAVIVSGTMGDHHAAILSARMELENGIRSDNAPLGEMVQAMRRGGIELHAMRDVTRGGLGTVLHELADASHVGIALREADIPVTDEVRDFAKILGLSLYHMGNEGKLVAVMPQAQAAQAVEIMRQCPYGENAAVIGGITHGSGVTAITPLGGTRAITPLIGQGLPRIC